MKKKVALALASGGPRGFAYIGAIEELLGRGYEISSIAGTSAGSLVGGIFAAGGLEAFKGWLYSLDKIKVLSQMDISISLNHLVKGEKIIETIKTIVPEVNIEDLPIPFAAVATDLYTGEEVVFREGPLFEAIRASISIPSMFRPVKWQGRTLVDGGLVNTFPLNRVARTEGDILVGFNVNSIDASPIHEYLENQAALERDEIARKEEARELLRDTLATDRSELLRQVRRAGAQGRELLRETIESQRLSRRLESEGRESGIPVDAEDNYATVIDRSFGIMNGVIARLGAELCPPDILVELPYDSYQDISSYSHAEEIAANGRELMSAALDRFEGR